MWLSLTTRPDCDTCTETWGWSFQSPPCGTCFPGIHTYNKPIMDLYRVCSDQVIAGGGGIIGLNDLAVNFAMDTYFEVDQDSREYLSMGVRRLSSMVLDYQRQKASKKGK